MLKCEKNRDIRIDKTQSFHAVPRGTKEGVKNLFKKKEKEEVMLLMD